MTHHHHNDAYSHHYGHRTGHDHSHGVVDPSITTTTEGLWALKWSFVVLMATALLQVAVVFVSGSVGLLADTIHNFGDAATAIPLGIAFLVRAQATQQAVHLRLWAGRGPCRCYHRFHDSF